MFKADIEVICDERLGRWKKLLLKSNATPLVLIAVGHGERCGKLVLCTTEAVPNDMLEFFLMGALEDLREKH